MQLKQGLKELKKKGGGGERGEKQAWKIKQM